MISNQLKRRATRFGVIVTVACVAIAACGGSDDSSSNEGSDDVAAEETTDDTSAATTPAADDDAAVDDDGPSGTVRFAPTTYVQTFDPAAAQNAQMYYLQPVYDTLLQLDADSVVQPGVAETWEWDGETATFTLRQGPAFHDGTPITAEAVKANVERFQAAGGPNSLTFASLESVDAPDDSTLVMTFSGPSPTLLTDLAQTAGMIMNPTAFDEASLDTQPAGTSGPYELDPGTSAAGDTYEYVAADGYWDPSRQAAERIEITAIPDEAARTNALQNGEIDVAGVGYSSVEGLLSQGFESSSRLGWLWYAIVLDRDGAKEPALGDPRVRQAMSMAIDREAVAEGLFFGLATPTPQPYLEGELGHVEGLDDDFAYDPDAARALLEEAGYADGFSIRLTSIASTQHFVQAVANYWNDIGIDATLEPQQAGGMAEANRSGDFYVFATPTALGDPNNWYRSFWAEDGPYNRAFGVVDETIDAAAIEGGSAVDPAARQAAYETLFTYTVGEGVLIPVIRGQQIAIHPDNVSDVTWHPNEFFPNPVGVSIEE